MRRTPTADDLYSLDAALRVAEIFGPTSAAARALAEHYRRTGAGENVALFSMGGCFIVGPWPQPKEGAA